MSVLDQIVSQIPGLSGYNAQEDRTRLANAQVGQQAMQFMTLQGEAQRQRQAAVLQPLQLQALQQSVAQGAAMNPLDLKIKAAQATAADLAQKLRQQQLADAGIDISGNPATTADANGAQPVQGQGVPGVRAIAPGGPEPMIGAQNGIGGIPQSMYRRLLFADPTGKTAAVAVKESYLQAVKPIGARGLVLGADPNNPGGYVIKGGALPPGAMPITYDAQGNPSVSPLPGQVAGAGALAGSVSGAQAAAKLPSETVEVTLGDGRKIVIPKSLIPGIGTPVPAAATPTPANFPRETPAALSAAGANQLQAFNSPNEVTPPAPAEVAAAASRANGQYPPVTQNPAAPAPLQLGQSTASKTAMAANETQLAEEAAKGRNDANIAVDSNYGLQHVIQDSQNFTPGRYTNTIMGLRSAAQSIAPDLFPKAEMDKLQSFQDFNKWATKLGFDQARKMGARESTQIVQMAISSNPNAEQVAPALQSVAKGLMAQNDYTIAKEKARDQWRTSHQGTLSGFNSAWQEVADPRAFLLRYQSPEEQKNLLGQMDGAAKAKLLQGLKTLRAQGIL